MLLDKGFEIMTKGDSNFVSFKKKVTQECSLEIFFEFAREKFDDWAEDKDRQDTKRTIEQFETKDAHVTIAGRQLSGSQPAYPRAGENHVRVEDHDG